MEIKINEVYYVIGSTLGILSFFQNTFISLLDKNQKLWEKVKTVLTEDELKALEYHTWNSRQVSQEMDSPYFHLQQLVHDYEGGAEYLRFGPLFRKQFVSCLDELRMLSKKYSTLLSEHWEYVSFPIRDSNGNPTNESETYKVLDKSSFEEPDGYVRHLDTIAEYVEKMRIEYRKMSILANLHILEAPFVLRSLDKRAAIPMPKPNVFSSSEFLPNKDEENKEEK